MSKKEKQEEEMIRHNLKMTAFQNRKKTKKIVEKKWDSEKHIIKPTQNAFDILSWVKNRSASFNNNLTLMINFFQVLTRK